MWSARGRARADAQGRSDDGAGSEESSGTEPSDGGENVIRGFCFTKIPLLLSLVKPPEERRPWASKREAGGPLFGPASLLGLPDTEHPLHPLAMCPFVPVHRRTVMFDFGHCCQRLAFNQIEQAIA